MSGTYVRALHKTRYVIWTKHQYKNNDMLYSFITGCSKILMFNDKSYICIYYIPYILGQYYNKSTSLIKDLELNHCFYWNRKSKIYFGRMLWLTSECHPRQITIQVMLHNNNIRYTYYSIRLNQITFRDVISLCSITVFVS